MGDNRRMSIRQTSILLGLLCSLTGASAESPSLKVNLDQVFAWARDNLEVQWAQKGVIAAQADIVAADHAPAPQWSAKLSQMDLQHGLGGGSFWSAKRIDKGVGLDWTWERGDKRGWRTQAATQGASAATFDLQEVRQQQLLSAQAAYFDLMAAQSKWEDLTAIARSATELSQAAAKRLAAGDLARQDADRAAIEADRARGDVDAMQAELTRARLTLAQLIGREREAVHLLAVGAWPDALPWQDRVTLDTQLAQSLQGVALRSDVQAAAARVEAAQAAWGGAKAQRNADVTWGASVDHVPGTSTRQVELRVQMPLLWGYRFEGEAARSQAQLDQSRDALDRTQRAAAAELQRLHAELVAAATRSRRYLQDIVPRSRSVADKAELAYAKGALSLTDLLDARRTLRAALMESTSAQADLAKAATAWQLRTTAR